MTLMATIQTGLLIYPNPLDNYKIYTYVFFFFEIYINVESHKKT